MRMVLTDLDPKAYRFLEKKRQDQEWCPGRSLNNVDPWFFGSTSPCLGDKNEKPATCNAPNVPNKVLIKNIKLLITERLEIYTSTLKKTRSTLKILLYVSRCRYMF